MSPPHIFVDAFRVTVAVGKLIRFPVFGFYRRQYRRVSLLNLLPVVRAVSSATVVLAAGLGLDAYRSYPGSVLVSDWSFLTVTGVPVGAHVLAESRVGDGRAPDGSRAMLLAGGGGAGMQSVIALQCGSSPGAFRTTEELFDRTVAVSFCGELDAGRQAHLADRLRTASAAIFRS